MTICYSSQEWFRHFSSRKATFEGVGLHWRVTLKLVNAD